MGDEEWIFASVINFLQSPLWSTPVFTYVDQNCIYFDKEEENKLEHTQIHQGYKDLVEGLIEKHVIKELGITEEQFLGAVQKEMENSYSKVLFDQVLSADDFLTFKKMMFRRNVALENEALAALHAKERANRPGELKDVGTPDEQIEAAIRLSKETYEKEKMKQVLSSNEEDLRRAIENSMRDKASSEQLSQKEQDELEKAIALSLAAQKDQQLALMKEEERLRILSLEDKLAKKRTATDEEQIKELEWHKQRLLDEERQNAANSALDRLFARRKILNQRELLITEEMDDDAKQTRQQQILEERTKLLEQNNKDRETALKEYLEK